MSGLAALGQYPLLPCSCTNLAKSDASAKSIAAKTSGTSSTSGDSLKEVFSDFLEDAITGLTEVAAQMASKRAAEFVEDRSRLKVLVEAAGWTSASASASSTSSTSSSGSSSDPVYQFVTLLGQQLLAALQESLSLNETTTDPTASSQSTTDQDTADTTTETES